MPQLPRVVRHPNTRRWLKVGAALAALCPRLPDELLKNLPALIGLGYDLVLVPLVIGWMLKRLPLMIARGRAARGRIKIPAA